MKICHSCNATYSDDSYNFCLHDGFLLNLDDEPEVETVISHKNFKVNPASIPQNGIAKIVEPVVAINIAQQYPFVKNDTELYQVTRGLWRLSRQRAETARYAFAVYKREIKEVFEIESWESAHFDTNEFWVKRKSEQGVEIDPKINKGRYQFVGNVAPADVRMKYVGKQMPVPHAQNPIRYFNC